MQQLTFNITIFQPPKDETSDLVIALIKAYTVALFHTHMKILMCHFTQTVLME